MSNYFLTLTTEVQGRIACTRVNMKKCFFSAENEVCKFENKSIKQGTRQTSNIKPG